MTRRTVLTPTALVMDTASPECVSAGRDGWELSVARWTQLPANVCPGVVAMADWTVEGVSVTRAGRELTAASSNVVWTVVSMVIVRT